MSEQANKSRFAIDLDDLEKQLKAPAPPAARGGDALAELARIVGRDDPLKGLFAQRQANNQSAAPAPVAPPVRIEPSFQSVPVAANTSDNLKGALDEFDALLRRDLSARGEPAEFVPEAAPAYAPAPFLVPDDAHISAQTVHSGLRPALDMPLAPEPVSEPAIHGVEANIHEQATVLKPVDTEHPIVDPFIDELEQHGRAGLDRPGIRPMLDERRVPHDLDEPREAGRFQRPPADDQLSRDLDEQLNAYPMPPAEPLEDMRTLEPRKSRKGLITIAALLGVAVIGVVGATTYRSGPKAPAGEPPVIKAETGPNKVAPQSPGGTEVPNQNKQIYERGTETKTADTKVVTREEQPLDVAQAAKTAARVILPGPGVNGAPVEAATPAMPAAASPVATPAPAATPPAASTAPGLGEPRKVRTVSIKPDGTAAAASPAGSALAPTPPARVSAAPTMVLPPGAAAPQAKPVVAPKPVPKPAAKPAQDEETAADATAPLKITPTPAARAKTQERAGERVANAPAPAAATTETPAATGGTGGFAVQLGAPGSEAEARSTFAALQRKFPGQLGGQSPLIRKADVNGREVYRLRVGPMSREGATSLCTRLKEAGGQCYVAGN